MKRFAIPGVVCMAFLFAAMLPALAQDDHPDNHNNDARQQERHDQARPQQDRNQPERQMQDKQKDNKQFRQGEKQHQDKHDHAARGEHENARRIDDAHYRQHFGRDHHFAVHHVERVGDRDQFAYGGYQFQLAEPWPAGWSYDDDCYIEDVDGQYYLYDLSHPGISIIIIVM